MILYTEYDKELGTQQLGRKIPDILYEIKFLIVTKHNKVLVFVSCATVELKSNVSEIIYDV